MNGNRKIQATGTTVRAEAIASVRAKLYKWPNSDDAIVASCDGFRSRANTIGGVIAEYIDSLSDEAYKRFNQECKRRSKCLK